MKSINNKNNLILWAFEKGYRLGNSDSNEGIFIQFNEIKQCFLNEFAELERSNSEIYYTDSQDDLVMNKNS